MTTTHIGRAQCADGAALYCDRNREKWFTEILENIRV